MQKVDFPTHGRPTTDVNVLISLAFGIGMTVVSFLLISPHRGTFLRDFFMGRNETNAERVVFQGTTLVCFWLAMGTVILKRIRLRRERKAVHHDLVPEGIDVTNMDQMIEAYKKLSEDKRMPENCGLSRAARIMAMWINTEDYERTSKYAMEESDYDAMGSDSSYRMNRLYIWAMPLLGFVGTVYGVSYGIGGFAEFLRGQVTAEEIKYQVGLITEGLAVAFYCTLLGLVTAGIAAFPSLAVERSEEEVFGEITEQLTSRLISRLPSTSRTQPVVIENLEEAMEAAFRRYIPDPDRYEEVFTRAIDRAALLVEQKFSALAQNYESSLRDLPGRLSAGLVGVGNTMETSMRKVGEDMFKQEQAMAATRHQTAEEEVERLRGVLKEMQASAQNVAGQYRESAAALQNATQESSAKSVTAAREIAQRMEQVAKMAAGIEELLKIEQAVEKGLVGISASDAFQKTLQDIRAHLATTDSFCTRLSKPRVITLREEVSGK